MGRSFTNETRRTFAAKKSKDHIARTHWSGSNEGIRLRSLASDLVWFEELRQQDAPAVVPVPAPVLQQLHTEKITRADVHGLTADELRLMHNQTIRRLGKLCKKHNPTYATNSELQRLEEWRLTEIKHVNTNCTILTQLLIDMKEPLTKPKVANVVKEDENQKHV